MNFWFVVDYDDDDDNFVVSVIIVTVVSTEVYTWTLVTVKIIGQRETVVASTLKTH